MKFNVKQAKHIMLDKDMSKHELAKAAGINYQNLCSYFSGRKSPGLRTVEKIAAGLGVSPFEIIAEV